jgi:peptide/nickel transport system substrate-binding protein
MALVVGACSSTPAASPAASAGASASAAPASQAAGGDAAVKIAIAAEPVSLDPALNPVCCGYELVAMFDTLVIINPDGSFGPSLAESWTVDGATITFKLRTGVKFHDGTDFNADAVKKNLDRIVDPATKSTNALSILGPYASSEVIDPSTVKVTWSRPFAAALISMANTSLSMTSPTAAATGTLGDKPVGTGPFKFVEWLRGSELRLERYDGYTTIRPDLANKGPAKFKNLTLQYVANVTTRANLVSTGGVDVTLLDGADAVRLESSTDINHVRYPTIFVRWFAINAAKHPDAKVREAIATAVDREAVVTAGAGGLGKVHYSTLPPPAFGYDASVESLVPHFDTAKAKALLTEAGYTFGSDGIATKDGKRLELSLLTFSVDPYTSEAQIVQDNLAQAGIAVKIDARETATAITAALAGEFDLYLARYGMFDGSTLAGLFKTAATDAQKSALRHNDPELDALLNAGDAEVDLEKRKVIYKQVQENLAKSMRTFTLYSLEGDLFHAKRISTIEFNRDGSLQLTELAVQ